MDLQQQNKERFNQAVDQYRKIGLREDEKTLIQRYFPPTPAKILMVGCGAGRTAFPLAEMGYTVTACDIAPSMIDAAQEQLKQTPTPRLDFLVADGADIGTIFQSNKFDVIWFPFHSLNYLYPIEHRKAALQACQHLLSENGVLIYNMHNRLFPRALKQYLRGNHQGDFINLPSQEGELWTYSHLPWNETKELQRYFKEVISLPRYRLIPTHQNMHYKERIARWLSPIFDKSFYYIAKHPNLP